MTIEVNTDSNNNITIDVVTTLGNANVTLQTQEQIANAITTTALYGPKGDKGDTGEQGPQGEQGEQGETGNGITTIEQTGTSGLVDTYTISYTNGNTDTFTVTNGAQGTPGVSPTATVTETLTGATLTVTDANGTTTADILNGVDGQDGAAATISVGTVSTGAAGTSATVVNSGTSSAAVFNFTIPKGDKGDTGNTGETGQDGYSPTATVTKSGTTATITITDKNGTTTANVYDGVGNVADVQVNGTSVVEDNVAEITMIPDIAFGTSTSAADATEKEVSIPSITTLRTGQVIVVQPTITSTVANSTIKLNGFAAYPMRYNNAAITTSTDSIVWSSSYVSQFVFDGTYWQFLSHGLDSNTTYTLNYSYDAGAYVVGSGKYAVSRYVLMLQKADFTWEKPTDTSATYTTATTKTVNTHGFRLGKIKVYNGSSSYGNGATIASSGVLDKCASLDLRYSTNCGASPAWTAGQYIYLVGTMGVDGLFYLDSTTWWTNTLPITNDGKVYIQLGIFLSDAKISVLDKHPVYYHDGNRICEYYNADNKQDLLVSGTNIKTVNNNSLLGSGDLSISASSDNSTITLNGNNELQASALVDQNSGISKVWTGTLAQYNAITTKDADTLYNITDDQTASAYQAYTKSETDDLISENCDGQWVNSSVSMISATTTFNGETTYEYSLASYLPNDGYNYEVIVTATGETNSVTGTAADISIGSSFVGVDANKVAYSITRTSSTAGWGWSGIIPIGTDRKIYIRQGHTSNCTCARFRCKAYRRIGTNS